MKLNVPNVSDKTMNVDIETAATYQPSKYEGSGQIYKVSSGDSLSKIAYQFGVSVSAIKSTNGLSSDTILIGQELLLPVDETIKIKPSEPLKENIEEAVVIKPILTNSIVSEKVSDNSKGLDDSEDTSTLSSLSEEGELDMDQVPQVDYEGSCSIGIILKCSKIFLVQLVHTFKDVRINYNFYCNRTYPIRCSNTI